MHAANAMDFDDLLVRTVNLLELFEDVRERYQAAFRHVLVDEYQDTNRAQYRLLQLLEREAPQPVRRRRRLPVDLRLPRRRHPQHPRVRARLPRHRGRQARAELPLDADDPRRRQRDHRPTTAARRKRTSGPRWARASRSTVAELDDEHAEARWVAGEIERLVDEDDIARDEIAVFYRTNAQSRVLEDTLVRFDVPYQVIGGTKFYERAEIKDAIAYLNVIVNPDDAISFSRIVNSPRRGIGDTTQARLLSHANTNGITPLEAAEHAERVPGLGAAAVKAVSRFAETIASLRAARRARRLGRRAARGGALGVRVHRRARGRAHGRGRGTGREPPASSSASRASSTPTAPSRATVARSRRSTSSCSRSRSSPTRTRSSATTSS